MLLSTSPGAGREARENWGWKVKMENSIGHGSRVFWGQVCTGSEEKRARTLAKLHPGGTAAEKEVNGSREVGRQVQPMPGEPGAILTAHP